MKKEMRDSALDTEADTSRSMQRLLLHSLTLTVDLCVRASGLTTRRSRASAQLLTLESKAEALRRLGCGDGGVRSNSITISTTMYYISHH
jgi:hypothetical protein